MHVQLHKKARTTPAIRKEIQESELSEAALARRYHLNRATVRKMETTTGVDDYSHCPHRLKTTLTAEQEAIVVEVRKTLLLSLDDLLVVTREFINPAVSRSGLDRCLRRHGVANLDALLPVEDAAPQKTFKEYVPGYVHIDVKYLPRMPECDSRRYLFVAIDRASRWVYLEIFAEKSAENAQAFLQQVIDKAPFVITKLLTDNGKEFTDRFCATGEREPTGQHAFDQVCQEYQIEHRLIKPGKPQTNGMVERFNGRISDIVKTTHFDNQEGLETTLKHYQQLYNQSIPQRTLGHITPIQSLKQWHKKQPELFKKRVYNLTGLDS